MSERVKIDISLFAIIKVVLVIIGVWFLFAIREIVVLLFIVGIIVAALSPIVDRLSKYMPRFLALIILALIFAGVLVGAGFIIIPPVVQQLSQLAVNLPNILNDLGPVYSSIQHAVSSYQQGLLNITNQLTNLTGGIYTTTVSFISTLVAIFTILVLSFYMLLEEKQIRDYLNQVVPLDQKNKIFPVIRKISLKMGNWLRGQAILMFAVGLLDGIALLVLGVPYALVLAVWGGLTEAIPYIGPWLGLIPAVAIAFTISPLTALLVVVAYVFIQQLEAQLLVPKIMGKAVGLSPIIIIISILVGAKLLGILGVIIAVPVAAAISVLIQEWGTIRKLRRELEQ